jgi:hypothetical protein
MEPIRVVVGNAPRSYREVLTAAFHGLRPSVEVVAVLPEEVDDAVTRLHPDLVVLSDASPLLDEWVCDWVILYPNGRSGAVLRVGGVRTEVDDLQFDALLSLIDDAGRREAA